MEEEVKERVSTLEAVLGEFIVQTNKALKRMERDTETLKKNLQENAEAMKKDTEVMKRSTEGNIEAMKRDTETMKIRMDESSVSFKKNIEDNLKDFKKEMNKRWGELANRLGTLAEDVAAPNLRTVAQDYFQCEEIDSFAVRVKRRSTKDRTLTTEFDVVLSCQQMLFIAEVKSIPKIDYVDTFIEKLEHIFDYFPEHEGKTVIPVFTALALPENVVKCLTKSQIYTMTMGGDTIELLNFEAVKKSV